MTIRRMRSGGPFEAKPGYCRTMAAGGFGHDAGTVGRAVGDADRIGKTCARFGRQRGANTMLPCPTLPNSKRAGWSLRKPLGKIRQLPQ
ncbi:RidA family protein [Salipiger aestuarii]|uniref:hypothetical protein n=1 Tax=Salipiger aestuarii TaxID=568098 RepID=UPI002958C678|nr:hypothetical protein [Salipiger aestuarii]